MSFDPILLDQRSVERSNVPQTGAFGQGDRHRLRREDECLVGSDVRPVAGAEAPVTLFRLIVDILEAV